MYKTVHVCFLSLLVNIFLRSTIAASNSGELVHSAPKAESSEDGLNYCTSYSRLTVLLTYCTYNNKVECRRRCNILHDPSLNSLHLN